MVDLNVRLEAKMSFARAAEAGDVLSRFYDLFLDSDPDVKKRFENTDFERQQAMIRASLETAIFTAANDQYSQAELHRVRSTHGHSHLGIPPHLYELWRDCLIQAVSEFDPEFREPTKEAWLRVLQPAIDFIASQTPDS